MSVFVVLVMVVAAFVPALSMNAASTDSRELRVAIQQDIPDFNIFNLGSSSTWKYTVLDWAFEGLVDTDYNGMPYPRLAQGWEFYENTLTVIVHLRQGTVFQDGYPLTADDVVFTYHAIRSGTFYSWDLVGVFDQDGDWTLTEQEMQAAVWKIDDYTVGMQMAVPYGQFFTTTLCVPIIPQEIWQYHLNYDGTVDTLWNDMNAARGSGPFQYVWGVPGESRVLYKNDLYWGKDFMTPSGYRTYPPNIDRLHFQIIASNDDAVVALMNGAVDHIASPLSAALAKSVESYPGTSVSYLEDNGYFYLAFNEKLRPMNYLAFRQAVAHLVDKELIVENYLDGLGVKGDTALPPYWGAWHNEAVVDYVYDDPDDPSTSIPEDMLDAAGFVDVNGDGWRDLPDGALMDELEILVPPVDYDSVRANAAEAIVNNLLAVGIKAEAVPVTFDTLVAKLCSMDYQMLILGWTFSGYSPVSVVFDVASPLAASNTWGFWSLANPNPYYADLGGVSTLADAQTQALADELLMLEYVARSTFVAQAQMLLTREAQAVIHEAQPFNVLYYRVNALATSDHWSGWVPHLGGLLNVFSLSGLVESPSDMVYQDSATGVNIGVSVPKTVLSGEDAWGYALVIDDLGYPMTGMEVTLSVETASGDPGFALNNVTGTTDSLGRVQFELSCSGEGLGVLTVSASSAPWYDSDSVVVIAKPAVPKSLALAATLDRAIIMPGEVAYLSLKVTDESGTPVADAAIALDEALVAAGYVDSAVLLTDSNGEATMAYHAPSTIGLPNRHLPVSLVLSASKDGYSYTTGVKKDLLVYNLDPPDWCMVRVIGADTTALAYGSPSTAITVEAVDAEGTRLPDTPLYVEYSDASKVSSPLMSAVTDGTGVAVVPVQVNESEDSYALKVKIGASGTASGLSASVTLTYVGLNPPYEEMYGGYITFSEPAQYLGALGMVQATASVWDSSGNPADVLAALMLSGTPYGTLTWSDDIYWDTTWDSIGVNIVSYADGGNYVTSGPLNTPFDEDNYWLYYYDAGGVLWWDWGMMTGVQVAGGSYTFYIYGADVAHLDLVGDIILVPGAIGYLNPMTYNYEIDAPTSIVGEYVIGRTYQAVSVNYEVVKPVLTAYLSDYDTTTITGTVTDEDGLPVEGAEMLVYQTYVRTNTAYGIEPNYGTPRFSAPAITDINGVAVATLTAIGSNGVPTAYSLGANVNVKPSVFGAVSVVSQSMVLIHPQGTRTALTPIWNPQPVGSFLPITVHAIDISGQAVPYTDLRVVVGNDVAEEYVTTTDGTGHVTLLVNTSNIAASEGGFMPVSVSVGGPAYSISTARMMVPMQNIRPAVEILSPADGETVAGSSVSVHVLAQDANGLSSLGLRLDGGQAVDVYGPSGSPIWDVTYEFTGVSPGAHAITATATDMYEVVGEASVTFTCEEAAHVIKKVKGASSLSEVSWTCSPSADGEWRASIENHGLRSLMLKVYDVTGGESEKVSSEIVWLSVSGVPVTEPVLSSPVKMIAGHDYMIVATPFGMTGTLALVYDVWEPALDLPTEGLAPNIS